MRTLSAPTLTPQDFQRFWSHVTRTELCWLWTSQGRAYFSVGNRSYTASAISFMIHTGRFPEQFLCHTCDDPRCINPDHLFEGSPQDNSQDMLRKGRHGNQKLTPLDVVEIRRRFDSGGSDIGVLSREYNVSIFAIKQIVHRKSWRNIA